MDSKDSSRQSPLRWTTRIISLFLFLSCTVIAYTSFSQHDGVAGCAGGCSTAIATSKDSSMEIKQDSKMLPSFQQGGIIFFLHVPKTGGISVRRALERGKGHYMLSDRRRKFDKYKTRMARYAKHGTNGNVIIFELHAADSPTLMELSSRLHEWRKLAKQNNVPFFAFSVLREPLSMAVSFFNYYNGMDHHDRHFIYYDHPSEQDFVDNAVFNPQCGFLARSDRAFYKKQEQQRLHRASCDAAYKTLHQHMDWVGTTDALSTETFPLLRSLIASNSNADHLAPENIKTKNKSPPKISQTDLSPKTIELIHNMTRWDRIMYEKAKHDYPYSRMKMEDTGDSS